MQGCGGLLTGLSCACVQYYFETIFPRIPKLVQDQFETKLTAMGLPSKAVGNAGQVVPTDCLTHFPACA